MLINDDKDRSKLVKLHWYSRKGTVKQISEMSSIMEVILSEKKINPLSAPLKIEALNCIPNIVPGNWISSPGKRLGNFGLKLPSTTIHSGFATEK